jgi:hypothetical protein
MTLTVRLPETMESQLARFCEAMGVSKSQVVQTALKDWFAKPAAESAHPLLAFAQQAVAAAPTADWPGPYSKERLRARVRASVSDHLVSEPVSEYLVTPKKAVTRREVAAKQQDSQPLPSKDAKAVSRTTKPKSIKGAAGA